MKKNKYKSINYTLVLLYNYSYAEKIGDMGPSPKLPQKTPAVFYRL